MTFRLVLIAGAALAVALPVPDEVIDRFYSQFAYARLQAFVTPLSNRTPVAWIDLLLVVSALVLLGRSLWDIRRLAAGRAAGRIAIRLLTAGAAAYLAFLVMWGLNYRRQPLRTKLPFESSRITPEGATALGRSLVDTLNTDYAVAHSSMAPPQEIDAALAAAFRDAAHGLGLPVRTAFARPKTSLLDLYFRRAGVAGMTDPFFLETLVSSDLLPFERAHVVAHEWAHLAGLADEGEASFAGWLACMRGNPSHRYSGAMALYLEVMSGLPASARAEVSGALGEGPRADLRAMQERDARERSARVSLAGWRVYDSYLKMNRVDAGTASYGEVVQLVLGTGMR